MRRTKSNSNLPVLFALACAIVAPQSASALTRKQLDQPVDLRVVDQSVAVVVQTLMQGAKVPYQMVGEGPQEVTDWRFKGTLSAALQQLSSQFGFCLYASGGKVFVVNPGPGEYSFVQVDAPLREAMNVLRASFPWRSANAVRLDTRSNTLRLCGPATFLQPSLDALKSWEQNRMVLIR